MARLKIVLWPVLLCRILFTSLGLMEMATAPWPAPYKTAGAKPLTRRRRASFFPRESRSSAVTVISFLILLTPIFYVGQDGILRPIGNRPLAWTGRLPIGRRLPTCPTWVHSRLLR